MQRRFEQQGLLAIAPTAFMGMFVAPPAPPERPVLVSGDLALVDVTGPLAHHAGGWEDSYDSIVDRVTAALAAADVTRVVMVIDSPGGVMHGAFDAARTLRERARAAGKPLLAWIRGDGCSAAYALACAAENIQVSASSCIGSIGVLVARLDQTAADSAMGVAYTMFQSGQRKPYGNPHVRVSPGEFATAQAQVDALAEVFFDTVSALRPSLSADALRALEAGIFVGAEAVRMGLADGVAGDLQTAVAAAGGGDMEQEDEEQATTQSAPSSSQADVDDAREALQRAANDGSTRARRALAVLEGDDDGPEDEDEDEDEADEESASASAAPASAAAPAAAAPAAAAPAAAAAAATVPAAVAGTFLAEVEAIRAEVAELRSERDGRRVRRLLASRKDLTPQARQQLQAQGLTFAQLEAVLQSIPAGPTATARRAAGTVVTGTQGAEVPGTPGARPPIRDAAMARAFGLAGPQQLVEQTRLQTRFHAPQATGFRPNVQRSSITPIEQQPAQPGTGGKS